MYELLFNKGEARCSLPFVDLQARYLILIKHICHPIQRSGFSPGEENSKKFTKTFSVMCMYSQKSGKDLCKSK